MILGSSGSLRLPSRTELYTNIRDTTAFNEADTIVIGPDNVTIFKVVEENAETGDGSEEVIV